MHIKNPWSSMTPEERTRASELCTQIQTEKDYERYQELTRELTELMLAKARRFPENNAVPSGTAQKKLHGRATRNLNPPFAGAPEQVEIHLDEAQHLYSELRIENSFSDPNGRLFAVRAPATLDVVFHAPAASLRAKSDA
jgi:hypothetical protein